MTSYTNYEIMMVEVVWWDGGLEKFECFEYAYGTDLLILKLTINSTIYIPLKQVRWFSERLKNN